jgi:hypothetical protein
MPSTALSDGAAYLVHRSRLRGLFIVGIDEEVESEARRGNVGNHAYIVNELGGDNAVADVFDMRMERGKIASPVNTTGQPEFKYNPIHSPPLPTSMREAPDRSPLPAVALLPPIVGAMVAVCNSYSDRDFWTSDALKLIFA